MGCLGFIAWLVIGYVFLVHVRSSHDARLRAGCEAHSRPGVARVVVPVRDVRYARSHGWPRVLHVGGDPLLGDILSYDHSPTARLVLKRTGRFCRGQRYTLVA